MKTFIDDLSAASIAKAVSAGELSAFDVAEASFDAIEQREPAIGAFLEECREAAFARAKTVDTQVSKGENPGILAGVPVGIKDNMHLKGAHTTCGSLMLKGHVSQFSATCVERLLTAGALPMGKLNMDEFAFGSSTETSYFHPTNNPWDTERVPGGSSGGSAAAVAAGMLPLTLGSDTGGSIRQPASFCGVVGMKPTYGVVSRYGVVAFASSLDQVGLFTRTVEDAALALTALTQGGKDPLDSTSQKADADYLKNLKNPIEGKKIGVVPALMEAQGLTPEMQATVKTAQKLLEDEGAQLVEVELPNLSSAIAAYYVIGPCEAFSNLARFDGVRYGYQEPGCTSLSEQTSKSRAKGFGAEAKRRQLLGAYLLASGVYDTYYYPAQQVRTLISQDYQQAFERCDAILMPTSPYEAFKHGAITDPTQMYLSDMFTVSCNIAGNGGISVPLGLGATSGLPVSAQIVVPAFEDARMLNVAYTLEQAAQKAGMTSKDKLVAPEFFHKGGELA